MEEFNSNISYFFKNDLQKTQNDLRIDDGVDRKLLINYEINLLLSSYI